MKDPRFSPIPKEPDTELFSFTYMNAEELEQTFVVYLTIYPAERLQDREIFAEVKMPVLIPLDPKCDLSYQLSNALYVEGVKGELKSVTFMKDGIQVTI